MQEKGVKIHSFAPFLHKKAIKVKIYLVVNFFYHTFVQQTKGLPLVIT